MKKVIYFLLFVSSLCSATKLSAQIPTEADLYFLLESKVGYDSLKEDDASYSFTQTIWLKPGLTVSGQDSTSTLLWQFEITSMVYFWEKTQNTAFVELHGKGEKDEFCFSLQKMGYFIIPREFVVGDNSTPIFAGVHHWAGANKNVTKIIVQF